MLRKNHLFFLLLMLAGAAGCSKKQEELPVVDLNLDKAKLALLPNQSAEVKIESGNGEYTAVSSSPDVAKATVSGNTITVTATTTADRANAVIVVTDKMFKRKSIDVEVAKLFELTLDKSEAALEVGVAGKDQITLSVNSGNYGYETTFIENAEQLIQIDKSKLESHGKLVVKALAAGTAKLKLSDAKGKEKTLTFTITAPNQVTVDKASVTFEQIQAKTEVNITNGNGGYKISVANPAIARVALNGTKLSIMAKSAGTTALNIEDKKGQKTVVNVTVSASENAMNLGTDYFAYANFSDIAVVDQSVKSLKKATFEMTCKIDSYRGLQTFMGLEGNLIIRGKHDSHLPTHPIQIAGLGDKIMLESKRSFNLNEWMHIALVVDCDQADVKNKYKLYINGVEDELVVVNQTETHTALDLTSSGDGKRFQIGRAFGQDFRAMRGTVAEARVWTVARSGAEIRANMCDVGVTTPAGLLARWKFSSGLETGFILDSNSGKYETNLIIANAKANGSYTQVKAPASAFVSKGCPNQ
ncbi:LamG-like jellyroll fold domain-containing protein [Pedobacter faecalis]|uniref:LamG-like jellyroll fold domain-containing protein n=1 Tax=Pedobacter faecalis TaxID=3041495 RepID=UPI0025511339|nr:LamG-like jellyroll fold domain-containing protein [Pedobacter sp. ELA7]